MPAERIVVRVIALKKCVMIAIRVREKHLCTRRCKTYVSKAIDEVIIENKDHSVREPQLGTSLNIYYKKSNPSIISDGTIYDSSIVSSIVFTLQVGLMFLCFCIQIKKR